MKNLLQVKIHTEENRINNIKNVLNPSNMGDCQNNFHIDENASKFLEKS